MQVDVSSSNGTVIDRFPPGLSTPNYLLYSLSLSTFLMYNSIEYDML